MEDNSNQLSGEKGFLKAMKTLSEEVSIVLKSHLLAEYYLDQIITSCIKRGDLLLDRFTFANKILIVKALDVLADHYIDMLEKLNKLRNRCSHQMDYKISETDIDLIGSPLKAYSEIKKKSADLKQRLVQTIGTLIAVLYLNQEKLLKKEE